MNARDFIKYLKRARLEPLPGLHAAHCVVIPALNESAGIAPVLNALYAAELRGCAVIVVVNHAVGSSEAWRQDNRLLLEKLRSGLWPGVVGLDVGELHDGVGEARKIGFDSFLATLSPEEAERAILYSLDADSLVEPEYFRRIEAAFGAHPTWGGVTVGFRHQSGGTAALEQAIRCYEKHILDYASGLAAIGSPYAYWAIGSCFAVRGGAYVRAGGMRRRTAGEDFYFLQALAKTAKIGCVSDVLVHPSARCSQRVPFGTGPALTALEAGGALPEFPAERFELLRKFFAELGHLGEVDFGDRLAPEIREFLREHGFFTSWPRVVAETRPESLRSAFHRWFDALKTQQFLRKREI